MAGQTVDCYIPAPPMIAIEWNGGDILWPLNTPLKTKEQMVEEMGIKVIKIPFTSTSEEVEGIIRKGLE